MKTIFIGSSSESLNLAETAKRILEKEDFEVTIWNEGVFRFNSNPLNDLLKATLMFDFAILLGTADDIATVRGSNVKKPRDNVIFELGLFMGRLGLRNCFLVLDKEIKILTDLEGINLPIFIKDEKNSFEDVIRKVGKTFSSEIDLSGLWANRNLDTVFSSPKPSKNQKVLLRSL